MHKYNFDFFFFIKNFKQESLYLHYQKEAMSLLGTGGKRAYVSRISTSQIIILSYVASDVLKEEAWQLGKAMKAGVFLQPSHIQSGSDWAVEKLLLHSSASELTPLNYIPRYHLSFVHICALI